MSIRLKRMAIKEAADFGAKLPVEDISPVRVGLPLTGAPQTIEFSELPMAATTWIPAVETVILSVSSGRRPEIAACPLPRFV